LKSKLGANAEPQAGAAAPTEQSSTARHKILFVDNEGKSRKERIAVLREHGFMVYPALDLQQAVTRCWRGAYDLIVVNSIGNIQGACAVCDEIQKNDPKQLILMMTDRANVSDRDYAVSGNPEELLRRVQSLFQRDLASQPVAA
jgi:DNA-binding response OmpR family regulator